MTPFCTRATTRRRAQGAAPAPTGVTSSATPIRAAVIGAAGLGRFYNQRGAQPEPLGRRVVERPRGCADESTSMRPKPRATTASPTADTGVPAGQGGREPEPEQVVLE